MFVVKLTYTKPIENLDELRPIHLKFLDIYYEKNIFIASGRQVPAIGGVILARGVSKKELENILQQDPFYIEKAATYEITEFSVNKFDSALKDLL
jgi:uncharacterized protein YciI